MLVEISNRTRTKIDIALVRKTTEKFLKSNKVNKSVSIVFVGDVVIRKLNKGFRKIDKVTDVLSFRETDSEHGMDDVFGEVIIDFQQIKRQAKKYGQSVKKELIFILVHGLLHLLGYDDTTDRQSKKMEELGNKFIARL